jgi:dienelactone hydrolase
MNRIKTMSSAKDSIGRGLDRRLFLESAGLGALFFAADLPALGTFHPEPMQSSVPTPFEAAADAGTIYSEIQKLADQCRYPLSFLEQANASVEEYRRTAREKVLELFHYAPPAVAPPPEVVGRWEHSDYIQEKILFSTAPWFRVPAYLLIPKGRRGRRPAIVDLHSHGGMFVFGREKVMPMPDGEHPAVTLYRQQNYEGRSTSLELCRRGYVVISIDAFYFGERRTHFQDDLEKHGPDRSQYSVRVVEELNRHASQGEGILARSLIWAGATWQGIVHWDDIRTVDFLVTRPEVDPTRIGCLGISMGGDRTDYLAGLDDRIQCAVSVGWMSTLRPMIRKHVATHSFVHFLPGLARFLDMPDVIACRAPKPLMVQQCSRDELYPLEGMKEAVEKIAAIYRKSGGTARFEGRFYDEPHIFSLKMQEEAFEWMDRWLQP